ASRASGGESAGQRCVVAVWREGTRKTETSRVYESAGLTRVFLQAGVRSVASTLWSVHQKSSGRLVPVLDVQITADPRVLL
ncbi:CHAT domain-containing protein, partial [Streptomyces sp. JV176]|uniref:CHAT domain-containing protein n=1 Tax=Streptomyces sp. JV176 TaxID=858630 RepID=UPI002E77D2C7